MRPSSALPALASPGAGGGAAKLARSASGEAKSRSELRHMRVPRGSKAWFSMRSTISGSKGLGLARRAEGAVVHVAPGAPGDLRQLGGRQVARGAAVELALLGEGDVVELQVEAHADGVGGHQVIDLAGLVQGDLGVAGARAQRPPSPPPRRRARGA